MGDEYTPTTEDVKTSRRGGWHPDSIPGRNADAEFDRWLAEHDREVRGELEQLRRLHEVATERNVALSAVIEKARAWVSDPYDGVHQGVVDFARLEFDILGPTNTDAALREVRLAERERCAEIAEQLGGGIASAGITGYAHGVRETRAAIAAAIREGLASRAAWERLRERYGFDPEPHDSEENER